MMFFLFAFLSDARCDNGTQIHTDLKQLRLVFPEEHLLSPPGNYGQGFLDGRLNPV